MPELPEVETVRRTLVKLVEQKQIAEIQVFWPKIIANVSGSAFSQALKGEHFLKFERLGKYLIFKLTNYQLIVHLRMEGKFYYYPQAVEKEKHSYAIFTFTDGSELHYHDVRKFGKMYLYASDVQPSVLDKLGYEIWDERLTPEYLLRKFKNRTTALKTALLDQSIIAGIGNIYAAEICYLLKLHPATPVKTLNLTEVTNLIAITKKILDQAILAGGTTVHSFTSALGITGLFQQKLAVYGKEGTNCPICGTELQKIKLNQRGTVFCPHCQKSKT